MTPNPKHLEILSEITGFSDSHLRKNDSTFYVYDALKAMQILQLRIDELEKENERLKVFDGSDDHPEHRCQRCTGRNLSNWFADNDEWNKVVGDDFSILCPNCFNELSELKGIRPISWRISREGDEPLVNKLRTELVSCRELKNPKNPE